MKILLIAKPWKGGLGRYFFLALGDMFPGQVEWISTRPQGVADTICFRRDPERWWDELRRKIDHASCDAAFFVGYRKEWRGLKPQARNILYIVDDVRAQPGDLDAFDRIFLSDPGYASELTALVPSPRYGGVLPFAYYPPIHKPSQSVARKHGVCFIGNRDAKRDPYIESLFANGIDTHVIGNYFLKGPLFWKHPFSFCPAVANEKMGDVYARHKVALNIHARVVRQGTNMRTFECAGYGIPQTVEFLPGIEAYFEPEKEILFYRSVDEMIAQIRALLANDERALRMAEAAQQRARQAHTYYHRIATVLEHLVPKAVLAEGLSRIGIS